MRIGLMSDTHGNVARTAAAARLFAAEGVAAVFHAGDIGTEAVLVELAAVLAPRDVPVIAVLGNVDGGEKGLHDFPTEAGVQVAGRFFQIELATHRIALLHGDDLRSLDTAITSGRYDLVILGHSHTPEDRWIGATRVVNPGAVYRAPRPQVAVLDLESGALVRHPLEVRRA